MATASANISRPVCRPVAELPIGMQLLAIRLFLNSHNHAHIQRPARSAREGPAVGCAAWPLLQHSNGIALGCARQDPVCALKCTRSDERGEDSYTWQPQPGLPPPVTAHAAPVTIRRLRAVQEPGALCGFKSTDRVHNTPGRTVQWEWLDRMSAGVRQGDAWRCTLEVPPDCCAQCIPQPVTACAHGTRQRCP